MNGICSTILTVQSAVWVEGHSGRGGEERTWTLAYMCRTRQGDGSRKHGQTERWPCSAMFQPAAHRLFNMNLNVNDNPLLVAPRPVRLTAAHPRALKIVHLDDAENVDDVKPARIYADASPPRASPRCVSLPYPDWPSSPPSSSLPSEALEEFLSILRPAIFPPSSPVLRPRRNGALTLPAFGVAYKTKPRIDSSFSKPDQSSAPFPDESDPIRQTPTCSPEPIPDHLVGNWDIFGPDIASRWHAQVLCMSSPSMSAATTYRRASVQPLPSPACTLATPSPVMPPTISHCPPSALPQQPLPPLLLPSLSPLPPPTKSSRSSECQPHLSDTSHILPSSASPQSCSRT